VAPAPVHDVVVIGAGIVGLATALRLLETSPGLRVVVVDREDRVAAHQSSHNSGVLHAGLYYPPGSAKARWCRRGKEALERFCAEHGVPVRRDGKLVVGGEDNRPPPPHDTP
jgi:(S)-2-hydroxyglutarate dehydrogenase